MNELVLVKQTDLNGIVLDCYVEPEQKDRGDFWATREQIGRLLGYKNAEISVANIHNRNKERLDKFSTLTKLIRVESGRVVEREVTIYNFKGLLEICRYSHKPKANAVMDWLWSVADEIRRTGSYTLRKSKKQSKNKKPTLSLEVMNAAAKIYHMALRCEDNSDVQEVLALDEAFKHFTGESALDIARFTLTSPDIDNETLGFEFYHSGLRLLRLQNERIRDDLNSSGYMNLLEEWKHDTD